MAKREINRLTTLGVKALVGKTPKLYPDGGNLFVRVDRTTGKLFYVIKFFSAVHQKTREGGIGPCVECSASPGAITLKEARSERDDWRKLIDQGIDPIDARKSAKATTIIEGQKVRTFGEVYLAWAEVADLELKNERTRSNRKRAIEWHLKLLWNVPAASVTPKMAADILKPLAMTKANTAHRLLGYIRTILAHADKLGTPTNSEKFSGSYFRGLIPAKEKVQPTVHHKALDIDEVPAFVTKLKDQPGSASRCLHFAILSALRSNEAIGLKWSYIDFNTKVVTFPAEVMKVHKEFRCALSDQAIELLNSMPRVKDCPFVFVGRSGNGKLSDRVLHSIVTRMGYDCTVHGFRSCFRMFVGERTDFDTALAEYSLAHLVGGKVERAYARSDNLAKRFAVMQSWANFCDPLPVPDVGDNVVPLPVKLASA
jgi:integrase